MKGLIRITVSIRMVFSINNRFNMLASKEKLHELVKQVLVCASLQAYIRYDWLWVCEYTWLVVCEYTWLVPYLLKKAL